MKPSVIIALLVGGIVGFAVGNFFRPSTTGGSPSIAAPAAPGAPGGQAAAGENAVFKVPVGESPVRGPANALVTIVEFSDYQCPFCSRANATIQQLEKDYEGKIRVAMKQHPLDFHPRAKPAALAAMAAGEQGKYWEMHDKMFANQQSIEDANLEQYARDLGLNVDKWKC
jgi:protein-disulfide isomerase